MSPAKTLLSALLILWSSAGHTAAPLNSGAAPGALGEGPPLLHELSSTSSLIVREPLVIRANDTSVTLPPEPGANGTVCVLWMNDAAPFDRVLNVGKTLPIRRTHRNGFSARNRIATFASVIIDSISVQEITCGNDKVSREPLVKEFESAVASYFELEKGGPPREAG